MDHSSTHAINTDLAKSTVPTHPWRGRVGGASSSARCEPGWGGVIFQLRNFHPTRLARLADPPPPGYGIHTSLDPFSLTADIEEKHEFFSILLQRLQHLHF
jgi:hypothetical protein